jgi:glycerophosphoryl diester phosphodiesterase
MTPSGENLGVPPLRRPPIGFAHRGGRADAPDNTLEAFAKALAGGATGLETDAWLTADGVVVLDHDGVLPGLRRRRIGEVERDQLPETIPSLAELFAAVGTDFELSVDLRDREVAAPLVVTAAAAGFDLSRLWLVAADDWGAAATWKEAHPGVRVADSTRRRSMKEGTERRAASMAEAGIDAVNLHHTDWTLGLVTLFHRFEIHAFAWDCQHDHQLKGMLRMGIDAVFSDHVDRLVAALPAG